MNSPKWLYSDLLLLFLSSSSNVSRSVMSDSFFFPLDFSLTISVESLLCAEYISRCYGYRVSQCAELTPHLWAYMSCASPNYQPRKHRSQAEPMLRLVNSMVWPDITPQTPKNSNKTELRFSSHPYAFEWGQAQRMKL